MPDPANATGDSSRLWLIVFLLLLLCNALCAAAQSAVLNFSESKLRRLADDGDRKAARVLDRLEEPSRVAETLRIGSVLTALFTAVLTTIWCVRLWWPALTRLLPFVTTHAETATLLFAALCMLPLSYLILVIGELVPGRIGAHHPEAVLLKTAGVWRFLASLFCPAATLLSASGRLLARLFGIDPAADAVVTEEDILQLMDAGEETGTIEGTQKDMIENIFAFDDITADEIMTPRTDVEALDVDDPVEDALRICIEEGFSRIPLYEQDIDHIIGVLYAKDLLPFVGKPLPDGLSLRKLSHETYFVPGTKRCGALFAEMSDRHLQMAIVVDEYGGVAGIVTMEDLLESIVGSIQDEYDHEEEEMRRTGEDSFEVDGAMSMEELCEMWEIAPPEGEFDTVAGFILDELGRIPTQEEQVTITFNRLTLKVLAMDDLRIEKVHVKVAPEEENT